MRATLKISIFLAILIVDLAFFIVVKHFFTEVYTGIVTSVSFYTQISIEATEALFLIAGFVIILICSIVILYHIYNIIKGSLKSL